MAASTPTPLTKGYIGVLNKSPATGTEDLTFQFNPTNIKRDRRATYANNAAALADFPNASTKAIPAFEWIRNEPEDFAIDLLFHKDGDKDVEQQLKQLDLLMRPDANTGQPRDLIFVFGVRSDVCRILEKSVIEKLFKPDLSVQEATVSLRLRALRSRSSQ